MNYNISLNILSVIITCIYIPICCVSSLGYDQNLIIWPETGTEQQFRFPLTVTGSAFYNSGSISKQPDMIYEIPVHTGIITGCNWKMIQIFQNLICLFKMHDQPKRTLSILIPINSTLFWYTQAHHRWIITIWNNLLTESTPYATMMVFLKPIWICFLSDIFCM